MTPEGGAARVCVTPQAWLWHCITKNQVCHENPSRSGPWPSLGPCVWVQLCLPCPCCRTLDCRRSFPPHLPSVPTWPTSTFSHSRLARGACPVLDPPPPKPSPESQRGPCCFFCRPCLGPPPPPMLAFLTRKSTTGSAILILLNYDLI